MSSVLYFDDLSVGQKWTSARRTVTESDVVIFAGMTGDFDRAHVDHDYASKSRFKQPLMHGLMGLAWAAGLSTTAPAVRTIALVSIEQWKFLRPVHIGDTVFAVTEVIELSSGGRSAGKVTWKKSLLNLDGEEVQSGLFVSFVELAPRSARPKVAAPHLMLATQPEPASNNFPTLASPTPASSPVELSVEVVHSNFNGVGSRLVEPPQFTELATPVQGKTVPGLQAEVWTIRSEHLNSNHVATPEQEFRGESNLSMGDIYQSKSAQTSADTE